jgi:hypothetical protein
MKRYKYGLGANTVQATTFGAMTPLAYMEVVPGDTVSGSIDITAISDTCNSMVMNQGYLDFIVCYEPFRLMWSGFPDFLQSGTGTVPTVTDLWPFNFEKDFTIPASATDRDWETRPHKSEWFVTYYEI